MGNSLTQKLKNALSNIIGSSDSESKPKTARTSKKTRLAEAFIDECKNMTGDYRSMKMYSLYRQFGYARRGSSNTDYISECLQRAGLYCYPKLDDPNNQWKNTSVKVYKFPCQALGTLFKDESDLQQFIDEKSALRKLGIIRTTDYHRPVGSSSILDFKGEDEEGNLAVIELKNEGGDNRGVEQVMRYKRDLQGRNEGRTIRKILITGVRDVSTAKAILRESEEDMRSFEWYLYKYDAKNKSIDFERVTNKYLTEHFARIKRDFLYE